jgi:hypothetical protein
MADRLSGGKMSPFFLHGSPAGSAQALWVNPA